MSSASRAASKITRRLHTTTLIYRNCFTMEAGSARVLNCLIALTSRSRQPANNTGSEISPSTTRGLFQLSDSATFFSSRKYVLGLKADGLAVFGDLGAIRWKVLLCFVFSWLIGIF